MSKTKTEKIDLYKLHKDQYVAPKQPQLVDIETAKYLAIDGRGEPGGDEFIAKIGALYAMAYTIKMNRKFAGGQDYVICKLQCQWWLDDGREDFSTAPREQWNWKLLIRTPDFVRDNELTEAAEKLLEKGKEPEVRQVKFESLTEGLCVQMLHVGPYDQEHETISKMAAFAEQQGLEFCDRHHEIYLSDPRRVPPQRLKTILRHPVRKKPSLTYRAS
ncbi:MAG: GyrI-like domain-containing protein [Phycisphaerales bacterium]|nr:MAG: GyrI-like domain-containing protein [Phycisphaerales bacterium]